MIWNKNIHTDVITYMNSLENKLVSLAINGEFKITTIGQGEVVAAMNLQESLPSLWKLELLQEKRLCRQVHQALTLISEIMEDRSSTREEKEAFNIGWFMKQICVKPNHSSFKKKRKSIKLLASIDKNRENDTKFESLKSMEAFRRVSLIREG